MVLSNQPMTYQQETHGVSILVVHSRQQHEPFSMFNICFIAIYSAVCGCGHGSNADEEGLSSLSREYQRVVQDLVNSGRYDGKSDFTVVNQPFLRETAPPANSVSQNLE